MDPEFTITFRNVWGWDHNAWERSSSVGRGLGNAAGLSTTAAEHIRTAAVPYANAANSVRTAITPSADAAGYFGNAGDDLRNAAHTIRSVFPSSADHARTCFRPVFTTVLAVDDKNYYKRSTSRAILAP